MSDPEVFTKASLEKIVEPGQVFVLNQWLADGKTIAIFQDLRDGSHKFVTLKEAQWLGIHHLLIGTYQGELL